MSNQRFIELSSSYRNRIIYPKVASFQIPCSPPTQQQQITQLKAVYSTPSVSINKVNTKSTTVTDVVTNGIIEYIWNFPYSLGQFNNDVSNGLITNGILTFSNSNPYITVPNYLNNSTIIFTDGGLFIGLSKIISAIYNYNNYMTITFYPSINATKPVGYTYQYTIAIDGGTIGNGSTYGKIVVNGLNSVYATNLNIYVGYQLDIYSISNTLLSSSIITYYQPSTLTFTIDKALSFIPTSSMYFTITDPSTSSSIVLPGVDSTGKTLLNYSQLYNGFYIVNETLSQQTQQIINSKINSYNVYTRSVILETPFPSTWSLFDQYSIRKTLPNQVFTTMTLSGIITSTTSPFTVTGLSSNYNYVGATITITGYAPTTILTSTNNNTILTLDGLVSTASEPLPFVITPMSLPTFSQVSIANTNPTQYYPQLVLSNSCIFLPSNANTEDNYYTGQYIYIYPNVTANNQTTSLSNIRGSCYYINAYVGNGYNACFVTNVNTTILSGSTEFYPSYNNTDPNYPSPGTFINIVSSINDNFTPLIYNGSRVSQNDLVAYEISLVSLTLPNKILVTGSSIAYYPYVYVELSVVNNLSTNAIYSNNPKSTNALFLVPIRSIRDLNSAAFIRLGGGSMVQTVKFKPNDWLQFSVYLPDGTLFEPVMSDYYSPSSPNPYIQIDAVFGIERLTGI